MKLYELSIGIRTDLKKLRHGLDEATVRTKTFVGEVGKASRGMSYLGMGMTAYAVAVNTGLLKSIKTFARLEQSIANAASVTNATTEEMIRLEKFARKMGETTIYKSHEAANAIYFLGCVKPNGLIVTKDGAKEIKDIKKGDDVFGFNGEMTKVVSNLMIRPCTEKKIIKITPRANLPFEVTPGHPVYAVKTEWCHRNSDSKLCKPKPICKRSCTQKPYLDYKAEYIPAGELKKGDAVVIPKNKTFRNIKLQFEYKKYRKQYDKLPKVLDKDFAKFLGIMLGDGWANCDGERIGVAFNDTTKKKSAIWFEKYLNRLGYKLTRREMKGCFSFVCWSRPLNKFIAKHLGQKAYNKKIPGFMFDAKKEIIKSFLNGYYLSDGSLFKNQGKGKVSITTVSPSIAMSINYLVSKLGYYFSVSGFDPKKDTREKWKDYNQKKQYQIATTHPRFIEFITGKKQNHTLRFVKTWQDKDFIYFPIRSIEEETYNGKVYNFETEDKTYSVGVIVHNSAGYDVEQIMGSLEGTLRLAAATQHDLAETTRIVVSNLNAFKLEATESDRVANAFAAVISTSQATMYKLGESLKYVAPLANALEISLERTSAAMGLVYNAGIHAQQAGTALRMGLTRLLKPSDAAVDAMKRLGLSQEELSPASNDLIAILDKLKKAGAGTAESMDELAEIFGMRAVTAWMVLVREGGKTLKDYEERITDTNRAAEMMEMQIDTLQGAWRLMTSALQEAANIIGKTLAPMIRTIVEAVRYMIYDFNALPTSLKNVIIGFTAFTGAMTAFLGPVLILIGQLPFIISGLASIKIALAGTLPILSLIAVAIGVITLGMAAAKVRSARAAEAMTKSIEKVGKYIDKRIEQAEQIKKLTKEYKELEAKEKKSSDETDRMKKILERINKIMPGTIRDTTDFAAALIEVEKATKEANTSLEEFTKQRLEFREFKIGRQIREADEEVRTLEQSLKGLKGKTEDKFAGSMITDFFKLKEANKLLLTFNDISSKVKVSGGDIHGEYNKVLNTLLKVAETDEGLNKIREDAIALSNKTIEIQHKLNVLKDDEEKLSLKDSIIKHKDIKTLESQLANIKGLEKVYSSIYTKKNEIYDATKKINDLEAERKKIKIEIEKPDKDVKIDTYIDEAKLNEIKKVTKDLITLISKDQIDETENEVKSFTNRLQSLLPEEGIGIINPRKTAEAIKELEESLSKVTSIKASEDTYKKMLQQLQELYVQMDMENQAAAAQKLRLEQVSAGAIRKVYDDELKANLARIDIETTNRIAKAKQGRERELAISEQTGQNKTEIIETYEDEINAAIENGNRRKKAAYDEDVENYLIAVSKKKESAINAAWNEQDALLEIAKLDKDENKYAEQLNVYRNFLLERLEAAKIAQEEMVALEEEYQLAKDEEDLARTENEDKKTLEALEKKRKALADELAMFQISAAARAALELELAETEDRIIAIRMRQQAALASFIGNTAAYIGEASVAAAMGTADAWKIASGAIVDAAISAITAKMKANAAMAMAQLPPNVVAATKWYAGISLVNAIGAVAKGMISQKTPKPPKIQIRKAPKAPKSFSAEIGAVVDKPGLAYVHPGEIVPAAMAKSTFANLRRLPETVYGRMLEQNILGSSGKAGSSSSVSGQRVIELNMNVSMDGSVITTNEDDVADKLYSDVIEPAVLRAAELLDEEIA